MSCRSAAGVTHRRRGATPPPNGEEAPPNRLRPGRSCGGRGGGEGQRAARKPPLAHRRAPRRAHRARPPRDRRRTEHHGRAASPTLAHGPDERHRREQRHLEPRARRAPPPDPNTSPAIVSTTPITRLPGLTRDHGRPHRDLRGRGLRRRHHEHLRLRQQLPERDRDVSRARRQVEQQHVEVAPEHVGRELLHGAVQHRPAPRTPPRRPRRTSRSRSTFTATPSNSATGGRIMSPTWVGFEHHRDPEQPRDGETEHVRIQHPDRQPAAASATREVRGDRRLADPALAARDGEHPGQASPGRTAAAGCRAAARSGRHAPRAS